mgnify:FL=1|tara:strand:+ start:101 stop:433 length:333 start_codon:yes stop_codon:yes gene_type:complete
MAITYTWEVTSLKTKTEGSNADAVVQTYWKKTGTDDAGNVGSFTGATPFSSADTEGFIAFADLTEAKVLEWIKAVVVDGYEEHVNEKIQDQIDEQVTPVVEQDMPWAAGE